MVLGPLPVAGITSSSVTLDIGTRLIGALLFAAIAVSNRRQAAPAGTASRA
jgi:hypothetical protein